MRRLRVFSMVLAAASVAAAQDQGNWLQKLRLQVHGNLAQGFLYSSGNNYMTADSLDGSGKWTDAALSVRRSMTDRFNVGAQVHSYRLGMLGRQNIMLDWAYGDFKLNTYFGVRAGKVKSPIGLYNEVQDVDGVHPWALLPQSVYPGDVRGFSLAHMGAVVYGEVTLNRNVGAFAYQAFGGRRSQPLNEGLALLAPSFGFRLGPMGGATAGLDLRWKLPIEGFTAGATYARSQPSAPNSWMGPYPARVDMDYTTYQMYALMERGKLSVAAEMKVSPYHAQLGPVANLYIPARGWYTMASYHATSRLTAGAYYANSWIFMTDRNRSSPSNYLKDTAVNVRLDLNRFVYCKVEGHAISGYAIGFYSQANPTGLHKDTRVLLTRVGFMF